MTSKIENRSAGLPEESQTEANPTSKTCDGTNKLRQARKCANGPYRCDWCGQIKHGMRRLGPRICHDCWLAYLEKKQLK